jgi:hypothetical protein
MTREVHMSAFLYFIAREREWRTGVMQRRAIMAVARVKEQARRRTLRSESAEPFRLIEPVVYATPPMTMADKLERAYLEHRRARVAVEQAMRHAPDDGRPSNVAPTVAVNGSSVARGSERWQRTPRAVVQETWDMTCYSIKPDGSREPFSASVSRRERRSKVVAGKSLAQSYEARVAALGAVGSNPDA